MEPRTKKHSASNIRRSVTATVRRERTRRERLEHLCRNVLRPPVAQDALELTPDGVGG